MLGNSDISAGKVHYECFFGSILCFYLYELFLTDSAFSCRYRVWNIMRTYYNYDFFFDFDATAI